MKGFIKRAALFLESLLALIIALAAIGGAFYYVYLLATGI